MKTYRGWRNHYRPNMPVIERITKDLSAIASDLLNRIKHKGRLPVIITWPDYPSKRTTIAKIAMHLRHRLTNKAKGNAEVVLFFHDQTFKHFEDASWIQSATCVINNECIDISKARVEAVHQEIFRYGTFIDPYAYEGIAVLKSNENAQHDGRYIDCPIKAEESLEGFIYQKVLDNRTSEGMAADIRVPVMRDQIPHCYIKTKAWELRFTNETTFASLHSPDELFSAKEIQSIKDFCKAMKADFCELDIIRDQQDEKIYIIDVNTTPYGPPVGLPNNDIKKAVYQLATAFQKAFID